MGRKEIEKLLEEDNYEYIIGYRMAASGEKSDSSCRPQYQRVIRV